jgi:antitoxin (DNA-binding transcriptional repressor) of toxin-antitoxin stability system
MAVMTISEARAELPDVVNRVAAGEEITLTRYGRPAAVLVRPDIIWSQQAPAPDPEGTEELIAALRARARQHGVTLAQEVDALLRAAGEGPDSSGRPPIQLTTVRIGGSSAWSRAEIYDDEGR